MINISFVSAEVINVCSTCNYSSIQSAINNASIGDIINVSFGTYPENIILNKSLTLRGAKAGLDARTRDGISEESVLSSNFINGTIEILANNVVINGFKIINAEKAIYVSKDSENVNIKNNYISECNIGIDLGIMAIGTISQNNIKNNQVGIFSSQDLTGKKITIEYNDFLNNILNIENEDDLILKAEENYFGECKPDNSKISGKVDYTPWIGACIESNSVGSSCILAEDDLELNTTINSTLCIGQVIFEVNSNNAIKNYTKPISMGNGVYRISITNFTSGETVSWKVYADDCFNHSEIKNGNEFYIQKSTNLVISPASPDGTNNWYISEPQLKLSNLDASQIYYKWDGGKIFPTDSYFGLRNAPNDGNVSGGIIPLTYWANLSCGAVESQQKRTFKFDLHDPIVEPLSPLNNKTINVKRPLVKVSLDDPYGGNSGINNQSIVVMINNNIITEYSLSKIGKYLFFTHNITNDLPEGINQIDFYVEDNAGRKTHLVWNFNVDSVVPEFDIKVNLPVNGNQGNRRVNVNISINRVVDLIEYINYNERNPKYKVLCKNCNGYGNLKAKSLNLLEGENNLTFKAMDNLDEKKTEVRIVVDSKVPKIISTEPKVGASVNGSKFSVKYYEDNLQVVNFYYMDKKLNRTDCESGKNKICTFTIPTSELIDYSGKYIDYKFEIKDSINSVSSKSSRVKVDIVSPILNVTSPVLGESYSRRLLFNLSVSEDSLIEYYDNSELRPSWKRFCVKCNKYTSTKLFSKGNHDIILRATDSAGNSDIKEISFSIA
jgi:hypothetical protein